jgi:hypothetical protein
MAKFSGVPYPIQKDPKGYFRKQSDLNQIKSDLLILLLTNPGERVMLPEYGTDLRGLIFEQNDSILASKARDIIIASIRQWEPRVTIQQLDVFAGPDTDSLSPNDDQSEVAHILTIRINFIDPENIQEVQDLTLTVPLG